MIASALAVDSDPVQLAFTARALRELTYDVFTASTFDEANSQLKSTASLSLLIADVRLGEFNGIHLALRARSRHPAIVVIITQDMFDPTLEFEASRLQAAYCVKPLTAAQVKASLAMLVQSAASQGAFTAAQMVGAAMSTPPSTRRWPRKQVGQRLSASIDDREAQLVDVSYGGLCIEFPSHGVAALPVSVDVVLPTFGRSLRVHPIWTRVIAAPARTICGSEVIERDPQTLAAWHHFVDACPA